MAAKENVIKTLKGKKVLFLENDNVLDNGLDTFEQILKDNGIEYKVIFEVRKMPFEQIVKEIEQCDCLVFMTQWLFDIARNIADYMYASTEKKIVIEVYISEPTWFYKPESVHDVYIYHSSILRESFYRLSDVAYWDYENGFDK